MQIKVIIKQVEWCLGSKLSQIFLYNISDPNHSFLWFCLFLFLALHDQHDFFAPIPGFLYLLQLLSKLIFCHDGAASWTSLLPNAGGKPCMQRGRKHNIFLVQNPSNYKGGREGGRGMLGLCAHSFSLPSLESGVCVCVCVCVCVRVSVHKKIYSSFLSYYRICHSVSM